MVATSIELTFRETTLKTALVTVPVKGGAAKITMQQMLRELLMIFLSILQEIHSIPNYCLSQAFWTKTPQQPYHRVHYQQRGETRGRNPFNTS